MAHAIAPITAAGLAVCVPFGARARVCSDARLLRLLRRSKAARRADDLCGLRRRPAMDIRSVHGLCPSAGRRARCGRRLRRVPGSPDAFPGRGRAARLCIPGRCGHPKLQVPPKAALRDGFRRIDLQGRRRPSGRHRRPGAGTAALVAARRSGIQPGNRNLSAPATRERPARPAQCLPGPAYPLPVGPRCAGAPPQPFRRICRQGRYPGTARPLNRRRDHDW